MSPFVSGALGALALLATLALLRRAFWAVHLRRMRDGRLPLRHLFRRLETRPEQERVITAEAEGLAAEMRALRGELRSVRDDLADLVASPSVDAAAVQGAIDARIARLTALRARLGEALAHVHAVLDPAQRATLAELLRRGHRRHGRCAHGHT